MEVRWDEARSQLAPGEGGDVLKPPPPALASMVQSGGEKPGPEASASQTPGGGSEQKGFFQLSTIEAPAADDAPFKAAKKPKVNTAQGEGKQAKSCSKHPPVVVEQRLPADPLPEFFSGKRDLRCDPYGNYDPAALEKWLREIGKVHALPPLPAPACLRRHRTCQNPLC